MAKSRINTRIRNNKVVVIYDGDVIRELTRQEAIECGGQIARAGEQIDNPAPTSEGDQSGEQTDASSSNQLELPESQVRPIDRLNNAQQQTFFTELQNFVYSERQAERDSNWERYIDLGISEAIRQERISGPFIFLSKDRGGEGSLAYRYQMVQDEESEDDINLRDDESLFEGNICLLDVENGGDDFPIEVELLSVGDATLKFEPNWNEIDNSTAIKTLLDRDENEVWITVLINPIPFERRLSAIHQVKSNDQKRQLLTGQRTVKFTVDENPSPGAEMELNEYQQTALVWADSADDIVCIHGPPGTGKTRTLTAYVLEAVSQGQSVLVTAHSNQAVDNLLVGDSTLDEPEEDTLHAIAEDSDRGLSIARVGGNSQSKVVRANYVGQSVNSADVVASTTSGAAQFNSNQFDVAVVDEATQASRPATAIVLNCAKKLVLAGDHKQLPPYCANESMQEEDMHISLFEYLLERYGTQISALLQKQYRMNERIAEFPNEAFYGGDLETASQNRDWNVEGLKPLMGIDINGTERQPTHGNSYYNREEAEAVAKQVKLLVNHGVKAKDIGVITAYSGQIEKINYRINQLSIENSRRVSVDTVDSFQGGEREAIIVSFVRSNQDSHSGFLEFPDEGPRRLNVAITRARKRLVLVANWETLGTIAPHRSTENSCASLYENLEQHICSNGLMLNPSIK